MLCISSGKQGSSATAGIQQGTGQSFMQLGYNQANLAYGRAVRLSPPSTAGGSTATPTSTGTSTSTLTATSTAVPAATWTVMPLGTPTPAATRTATPTPPSSPTPTRTATLLPTATPYPRPNLGVAIAPTGAGQLQVTLTGRDAGCSPNNRLAALSFTRLDNATMDVPGDVPTGRAPLNVAAPTNVPLLNGPPQIVLTLHRTNNSLPTTVQVTVSDGCGEWPTFVGGGPSAF